MCACVRCVGGEVCVRMSGVGHVCACQCVLGLKLIVYFDIQIFFNFQINSPNILYI